MTKGLFDRSYTTITQVISLIKRYLGLQYKGAWNASTNTPTLADGVGNNGDFYRVSVAGTRNLGSGPIDFTLGDEVRYSESLGIWQKFDTGVSYVPVNKSGDTMTGPLTMSGAAINEAAFVTLASNASGTTDIGAVASNNILLTGSNPITSFGTAAAGTKRTIRVGGSGGSLITYNQASLITVNAKNIVTAGNDCFEMFSLGSGNWLMLSYKTGNGRVLASTVTNLTDASTVVVDLALSDSFRLITTSAVGATRQLGVPTNVAEGQKNITLIVRQDSSGSGAMTFGWCYVFPQGLTPILTTYRRAIDFFKLEVIRYVAPAAATVTIANPAVVTQTAHGHSDGDIIAFTATTGALPTGLSLNTPYWVDRIDANSYRLFASQAACQANTPNVATSGSQSGTHTVTGMQIVVGMNANIGR